MKGREVREALQGKADPTLVHCLASVAEDVSSTGAEIKAIAELLDQLVDVIAAMQEVTQGTQDAVDQKLGTKMKKIRKLRH